MTDWVSGVASVLMVVVSVLLFCVNRSLLHLHRLSHKNTLDPDLRAFDRWHVGSPVFVLEGRLHEAWEGDIHLWNTGASTVLVTGWEAIADGRATVRLWKEYPGNVTDPPIAIPPHSEVHVRVSLDGVRVKGICVKYQTAGNPRRELFIPVKTDWARS